MYRKQFLFTNNNKPYTNLKMTQCIGDYFLYIGEDSDYTFVKNSNGEFHLLGSMYSWENPEFTNKKILKNISQAQRIQETFKLSNSYCGEFVLIVNLNDAIFIFSDATAQKEVYYDDKFTCFGSQPKLLGLSTNLFEHNNESAKEFYGSNIFKNKKLFVGNSTHKRNIYHLMPNHVLNVKEKSNTRYFPTEKIEIKSLEYVSTKCSKMIKGYISAISKRNKLKMAVTGGYDSRVLFLASLDNTCEYYISRHNNMNDSHHDIFIPKRLTKYYGKEFIIEDDKETNENFIDNNYLNDIDFPRLLNVNIRNDQLTYINGNISEIARNYFGYHKNATAEDLCFLSGYSTLNFAINQYRSWLKDKLLFMKCGYNYLDMFYWEEKMGNWAAKAKTESQALGRNVISPFNSKELLILLLSTKRKDRDSHFNHLYNLIIYELSGKDKEIKKMPINPCRKQTIIRFMKHLRLYNLYRHIGVKTRKLKL